MFPRASCSLTAISLAQCFRLMTSYLSSSTTRVLVRFCSYQLHTSSHVSSCTVCWQDKGSLLFPLIRAIWLMTSPPSSRVCSLSFRVFWRRFSMLLRQKRAAALRDVCSLGPLSKHEHCLKPPRTRTPPNPNPWLQVRSPTRRRSLTPRKSPHPALRHCSRFAGESPTLWSSRRSRRFSAPICTRLFRAALR